MSELARYVAAWWLLVGAAWAGPPETPVRPVTNTYHGVKVVDPYQWLEDWEDPEVRAWSAAQNQAAREYLDALPQVDEVRREVTRILTAEFPSYGGLKYKGGRLFAIKNQPPKEQPFLVVLAGLDTPEPARVLVDPSALDAEGTTSIDWYKPSPDGKLVAVSLSKGGTETGDVSIYEVYSGERVFETIAGVNSGTAGGSLAWAPDSRGFYYTRHFPVTPEDPDPFDVYQQVYFHTLCEEPSQDRYELGKGFPEIAEIQLVADEHSSRVLATVQHGDGGKFAHYLREADGTWRQFSRFEDGVKQVVFGRDDNLYVVTLTSAPRGRILRVSAKTLHVQAGEIVVPEGPEAIITGGDAFWGEKTVVPTESRLYVLYQSGGPTRLRVFGREGTPLGEVEQLPVSDLYNIVPLEGDDLLFANSSYVEPKAYYRYAAAELKSRKTDIANQSPVSLDDVEVVREFATSADGTRVPLTILARKGTERNGANPCLVTGYGGYGVSISPHFDPLDRVLLDRGFVIVIGNLRGGGEYGEPWHLAGNLTNKQNVFDDFAAVIRRVIELGYTQPSRLAIEGGSNGGLLMGATLTQHPDLMKCVVSHVGMYDMLRCELSPNGEFNITEFGTVENEEQFRALYAYSPYHHVQAGAAYPAVLMLTGENDPRVDPAESRKMTARLEAATSSKAPILLRTSANAGHGGGNSLSEEIEQSVDVYAFLFAQLAITQGQPTR